VSDASATKKDGAIRPLTDAEFVPMRDMIYRHTGIFLSAAKKALLVGRLARRLRALDMDSFTQYFQYVRARTDPLELNRLIEAICTHETHFFREPRQFEYIERHLIPEWERLADSGARPRSVRVWTAGCSSGEEPYSVAMSLLGRLGTSRGWRIEILATDISTRVLERAETAVWPIAKAAEIPTAYLRAFMMKGMRSREGLMKAGPVLRSVVRFARHNLSDAEQPIDGVFDLILCRNVLIYFDAESRRRAIQRLISRLAPDGRLFLGHSESLNGVTSQLCSVGPTIYGWPGTAAAERGGRSARSLTAVRCHG
jgi:chemotaxis protein methyltransferase CheR